MIDRMAGKIAQWNKGILKLSEEESKVVEYGVSVFLDSVFKFLVLLFISILIGKEIEFGLCLFSFCGLRYWAGGIHCSTRESGSFAIGGSTLKHDGVFRTDHFLEPEGQIAYGDHAYAFYQVPVDARPYPLIFQHGGAQCKRTWETTPDGREGFQTLFLRKGYTTVLIDQPRMGEAGLALKADDGRNPYAKNPLYADKTMYMLCRCGIFDGDTPDTSPTAKWKITPTFPAIPMWCRKGTA